MQSSLIRAFMPEKIGKTLLIVLAFSVVVIFFGDIAADALRIIFGACLLAFLVSPLTMLLERKLSRRTSALLSLIIAGAGLLGALSLLLPIMIRQFSALVDVLPGTFGQLRSLAQNLFSRISRLFPGLALRSPDLSALEGNALDFARNAAAYAGSFAGGIYRISLSAILSYFFMADRENIFLRLELLIPSQWRRNAVRTGKMLLRELRLYLRGQLSIALSVGILSSLGLTLIGVPGGVLLGFFVGIFNVIPYFGPLLGGIPAFLLALGAGWQKAALTAGVLFLVQQIDSMIISPRILGNITGFSPAVVLIALYLASRAGGITGMLLAIPLMMALRTLYRVFVQRYEKY